MSHAPPAVGLALALAAPLSMAAGVRFGLERRWPAHLRRTGGFGLSALAWAALLVGQAFSGPALGGLVTLALNQVGGGLVVLPATGAGWLLGTCVYVLAMDFGEWAFHRAQHGWPWLWAMHSLHHSDTAFDTLTTERHFWLEPAIKTLTIWLAVGLLFKVPAGAAGVYAALSLWHFVVHSDTRIDFGRGAWALNAPAYHRLHHSRAPEHFDRNFASLFPVFDVLAGAYRPPRPGEVILTGLDTGEAPRDALDVLVWPLRGWRGAPSARPAA